jgi:hypothetical protein
MIKKLVNYDSDDDSDHGEKPKAISEISQPVPSDALNKRKINLAEVPLLRVSKLLKTVQNSDEHTIKNADDAEDENWRPSTLEEIARTKKVDTSTNNTGLPKKLVLSEPKHNQQRVAQRQPAQNTGAKSATNSKIHNERVNIVESYVQNERANENNSEDEEEEEGSGQHEDNENSEKDESLNINPEDDPQFVKKSMYFRQERESANPVVTPINERDVLKEAKQRSERRLADEGLENVRIKSINGNDLLNFDWMSYHQQQKIKKDLNKTPKGLPPNKLQKSKHQLTYLAYEAISKEDELEQRLAEQRLNSRTTNAKYGW